MPTLQHACTPGGGVSSDSIAFFETFFRSRAAYKSEGFLQFHGEGHLKILSFIMKVYLRNCLLHRNRIFKKMHIIIFCILTYIILLN